MDGVKDAAGRRMRRSWQMQGHFTDFTDEQWERVRPLLLASLTRRYLRTVERSDWTLRDFVNGLSYVSRYRCRWKCIPREFPPAEAVYRFNLMLRKYRLLRRLRALLGEDMPFGLEAFYKRAGEHGGHGHDRPHGFAQVRCMSPLRAKCHGLLWHSSAGKPDCALLPLRLLRA